MTGWDQVATALLGSWPSQVSSWSREAIAAYMGELEARGIEPDEALLAVRSHDSAFPPSAAETAATVAHDPLRPTFTEAFRLIYGPGGVLASGHVSGFYDNEGDLLAARNRARLERAYNISPLLGAFCQSYGMHRLTMLEVDHDDHAGLVRRDLQHEWERFVQANEHRDMTELAAGRRRELSRGPRKPGFQAVLPQGEDMDDDEPF